MKQHNYKTIQFTLEQHLSLIKTCIGSYTMFMKKSRGAKPSVNTKNSHLYL